MSFGYAPCISIQIFLGCTSEPIIAENFSPIYGVPGALHCKPRASGVERHWEVTAARAFLHRCTRLSMEFWTHEAAAQSTCLTTLTSHRPRYTAKYTGTTPFSLTSWKMWNNQADCLWQVRQHSLRIIFAMAVSGVPFWEPP